MDKTQANPLVDQLARQYIEAAEIEAAAAVTGSRGLSIIANLKRVSVETIADSNGIGKEVRNRVREITSIAGKEE